MPTCPSAQRTRLLRITTLRTVMRTHPLMSSPSKTRPSSMTTSGTDGVSLVPAGTPVVAADGQRVRSTGFSPLAGASVVGGAAVVVGATVVVGRAVVVGAAVVGGAAVARAVGGGVGEVVVELVVVVGAAVVVVGGSVVVGASVVVVGGSVVVVGEAVVVVVVEASVVLVVVLGAAVVVVAEASVVLVVGLGVVVDVGASVVVDVSVVVGFAVSGSVVVAATDCDRSSVDGGPSESVERVRPSVVDELSVLDEPLHEAATKMRANVMKNMPRGLKNLTSPRLGSRAKLATSRLRRRKQRDSSCCDAGGNRCDS